MRPFLLSCLLSCLSSLLLAQPIESYIKRFSFPDAADTILGKEVLVPVHAVAFDYAISGDRQYIVGTKELSGDSHTEEELFVSCLTEAGDELWTKRIDVPYLASGFAGIIPRQDGGIWLIYSPQHGIYHLAALDSTGQILHAEAWGQADGLSIIDAIPGDSSDLYILTNRSHIWYTGEASYESVIHLSSEGNMLSNWGFRVESNSLHSRKLIATDDGGIIVSGGVSLEIDGERKGFATLIKLDALGSVLWAYAYDGNTSDYLEPDGLLSFGNGAEFPLNWEENDIFDHILVRVDGQGLPVQVKLSEATNFAPERHFPGSTYLTSSAGTYWVSRAQPEEVTDPIAGLWQLSRWNAQGEIDWSFWQGNTLDSMDSATPLGLAEFPDGDVGYISHAWATFRSLNTLLIHVRPSNMANNTCSGAPIAWTPHDGSIQEIALTTSPVTPISFVQQPLTISLIPDSLIIETWCESQNVQTAAAPVIPISVGPNPTVDQAVVRMEEAMGEVRMQLSDLSGRIYRDETLEVSEATEMPLDMREMQPGMYLLTMRSSAGVWQEKVIKIAQ